MSYDVITDPVVGTVGVQIIINQLTTTATQVPHVQEALGHLFGLIDDAARPGIDLACRNYFRSLLEYQVGPELLSHFIAWVY
jgi:hypothetical protein